ncbi:IclR family transcriptional regulator domain-containing protein [Aurantimicrobium minutum]|uniref:IclR family transcriptional regulator domain-containing protein n=1 Tax=Aurantimicrobium minutum TaxID=708131 RepID=UPI002474EE58|nr:IclR family transcriptional regulator C-terminal domain-containing protein [Aurantimicrobium minutum]MDH6239928.1 IclR family pca regulon transcriptional regulator [Aurantimicrobium minutum]
MSSEELPPELKADYVQSLERGLKVISAFSKETPSMTLSEVAEAVGLTRATARRFLITLEALGYISSDGKDFSLTPKVLDLGFSYLSSLGLTETISPHLSTLSNLVHESASAAILDGNDIVYVARAAGPKIMQVQITIGTRFPAAVTSMGRVLLSGLPTEEQRQIINSSQLEARTSYTKTAVEEILSEIAQVGAQGFAFVDQELELGLRSLAVPIRNRQGNIIAAINVSTAATGSPSSVIESLLKPLLETARDIERSTIGLS